MLHSLLRRRLTLFLLFSPTLVFAQQPAPSTAPLPLDPSNLDPSVKPTDDFYRYAAGGWIERNPVPPEYGRWGAFNELQEKNYRDLREILDAAAAQPQAAIGTPEQLIGDFYASGMDSSRAESLGLAPLQGTLGRIAALQEMDDLAALMAYLKMHGISSLFGFYANQDAKNSEMVIAQLSQGGLGLPDRDYYTKEDERSKKIREQYVAHVERILRLAGEPAAMAASDAQVVLAFETRLAKASMTRVERRDPEKTYHRMGLNELNRLTPHFRWEKFFREVGLDEPGLINVQEPAFFQEVDTMVTQVARKEWKAYFRWQACRSAASALTAAFVEEEFNFNGKVLSGAKEIQPRWKRVLRETDGALGDALGRLYVREYFPPEAMAKAKRMVDNLRASLRERIATRSWMSEATKKRALEKLDAFTVKIGYPGIWKDYAGLEITRGSYFANIVRADSFAFARMIEKIGKPVDRNEWGMTPPTVNAYYNASKNEIVFPAGILQPPFFDPRADDAVNYGGMGAVIGHEMTHGFDDHGSQYDAKGNLENWWTAEDRASFEARAKKLEEQYSGYLVLDSLRVNGKLTLGENIADLGGLTIAYHALEASLSGEPSTSKIDGFTPQQRFFLAWAQIWRSNSTPEDLQRRLIVDVHSPGQFRTNGPVSNMVEFEEAFGGKAGDPMVRPEGERVEIW